MSAVSASDWVKGISLSVLASIIGGASKLAIRKSWLMEEAQEADATENNNNDDGAEESLSSSQHSSSTRESLRQRHSFGEEGFADEDEEEPVAATRRTTTQRQFNNNNNNNIGKKRNCLALTLRVSGMIGMTVLNPACCVLAMNYASPSILAPFSGLTLVWIVLFSQPLINERPTCIQVGAASLIVLGEVVVAIFGDHTNDEGVTVEQVRDSYFYPPFLLFFVALTAWMLLLWYWMRDPPPGVTLSHTRETLKRFSWGVSGGSITGLQNFLKDSLTILKAVQAEQQEEPSLSSSSLSLPWYWPLFFLLAAGSAFGGLLFLTACMKRYDATYSAAMFVGSFVVSASIMSAVHYGTFAHLDTIVNWILYPAGLLILMAGVWMLVREQEQRLLLLAASSPSPSPPPGSSSSTTSESRNHRRSLGTVELQEPLVVLHDEAPLPETSSAS